MASIVDALLLALAALWLGYCLHSSVFRQILDTVYCRVCHMYAAPCHDSVPSCKYSCKSVMLMHYMTPCSSKSR